MIEKKRELYPPENMTERAALEECIQQVREKQDKLLRDQLAKFEAEEKKNAH